MSTRDFRDWNVHVCVLDADCRRYAGWCWRVSLTTPWFHVVVALSPGDCFVVLNGDGTYHRRWTSFDRRPQ